MTSNDCTLRIASPADADAVTVVLQSAYPALMARCYDPAVLAMTLPAMTRASPVLLASGSYYVQETAEPQVVSCGGWTHEAPGTGETKRGIAHVRHFGTHVDCIGRGLGRGIFERCERDALAAGVHTFMCFSSLNAEPFYRALGFGVVDRLEVVMKNGMKFPTLIMVRRCESR